MAVAILLISILLTLNLILFRTVFSTSNWRSNVNQLIGSFEIAQNTAIHSNQLIYFEFDFFENSYMAYRINELQKSPPQNEYPREDTTDEIAPEIDVVIKKKKLDSNFRLIRIYFPLGLNQKNNEKRKIIIPLTPDENYDDFMILLGTNEDEITKTIVFQKMSNKPLLIDGEASYELKDGIWKIKSGDSLDD